MTHKSDGLTHNSTPSSRKRDKPTQRVGSGRNLAREMASLGATAAADPATSATGADAIARYALAKAILTEHQGRIAEAKAAMLEGSLIDAELVRMQRAREGAAIQSAVMSLAASVSHELVGLDVAAIHARLDRWSRDTLLSVASGEWEEDIDAGGDAGEGDDDA